MKTLLSTITLALCFSFLASGQSETLLDSLLSNQINRQAFSNQKTSLPAAEKHFQFQAEAQQVSLDCNPESEIYHNGLFHIYKYNFDQDVDENITMAPAQIGELGYLTGEHPKLVTVLNTDSLYYYDGQWTFSGHITFSNEEYFHLGSGSKGSYLVGEDLYYFNGTRFPKKIRSNINSAVADVVVDQREYAYIITGDWPIAESLKIIDSTGVVICDIPFTEPVNTSNGYGMVIKDGKIYVGFGSGNPNYPNSLVPLVPNASSTAVSFGTPLSTDFIYGRTDLAGCSKVVNSAFCRLINDTKEPLPSSIKYFPNPVEDVLSINCLS